MKNIYLIQNSDLSFDMDISKIADPQKYSLFLIINNFGFKKLKERRQEHYFKKTWIVNDFSLNSLKDLIFEDQKKHAIPFQIITNAEEAIVVCGQLRQFFKTDMSNFDRFKNKIIMKQLLKEMVLTPKYVVFNKNDYKRHKFRYINYLTNTLTFPLIAKPINGMGCIGIQKLNSIDELYAWSSKAVLTNHQYEIEQFINGKVYNCDSFIKNNKIVFTQVSECSNSCYDFICGMTKGTIALPHNDPVFKLLCDYSIKIHNAIGTPSGGVTHLEVIVTNDEQLYFIEIGHRSPGVLIPAMYKKFLDIDTIESHILLQINDDYNFQIDYGYYCAWIAFPTKSGILKKKNTPSIKSNFSLEWLKDVGDDMADPTCGRDYAGRLLMWNNDYHQLRTDFNYLNSYQFYDI